jgi:hypothetical protein
MEKLIRAVLRGRGDGNIISLPNNIRQYPIGRHRSGKNGAGQLLGFKTLITPSQDAQKRHLQRTGTLIRRHRGASQEALIKALGPVIAGWSRYYAHVAAKAVFVKMYHRVHHQLRRWAYWRQHNKCYRWRMHRYWQRKDGGIVFGKTRMLPRHPETPMTRHAKVAGTRSPYDGDWAYGACGCGGMRASRHKSKNSCGSNAAHVDGVDCTSPPMIGWKCIIGRGTVRIIGSRTLCYSIVTVMIRCIVPMTRAIRLRSCMLGNGHVQFCSGRGRGNPPPDRNQKCPLPIYR